MIDPIVIKADQPAGKRVTRLAPSPTGALHLGNARTFLINWALARQNDWRIVLRIEDLDTPRTKDGAAEQAVDDLAWLGMDWDDGPFTQASDLTPYQAALQKLWQMGVIYPCVCTRKEIEQAQSAPNEGDHELRYPGTCRPTSRDASTAGAPASFDDAQAQDDDRPIAWRLIMPEQAIRVHDEVIGWHDEDVATQVGDFLVATKAGMPAYQLAVVIDDARQGVTDVVRGDDLLRSTARQAWLYRLLDLHPVPRYWHLPLVRGDDGRRLAKRHGDTRLATYRDQGVPAERVIGLMAFWCGIIASREAMSADAFRDRFDIRRLPRAEVTFTAEDHAWLTA